ncbi:hypothetical protein [Pseudoalteromonas sp. SG45-2]|uniref:hypothetical protein n=1 Tax=Pseudoalteromonas sp. SG45-2 TaxID=2760956 RepID=UPI00160467A7|nr:hypothetical protein [Pseudoalteromonas sp. SG45-2]MBB1347015.1 hypothetical protein [Pseudoalteromonas sp. SG45-2]
MINTNSIDASPFHEGELAVQDKLGKREIMATFGKRAVRSFMPEQHRKFVAQKVTSFIQFLFEKFEAKPKTKKPKIS